MKSTRLLIAFLVALSGTACMSTRTVETTPAPTTAPAGTTPAPVTTVTESKPVVTETVTEKPVMTTTTVTTATTIPSPDLPAGSMIPMSRHTNDANLGDMKLFTAYRVAPMERSSDAMLTKKQEFVTSVATPEYTRNIKAYIQKQNEPYTYEEFIAAVVNGEMIILGIGSYVKQLGFAGGKALESALLGEPENASPEARKWIEANGGIPALRIYPGGIERILIGPCHGNPAILVKNEFVRERTTNTIREKETVKDTKTHTERETKTPAPTIGRRVPVWPFIALPVAYFGGKAIYEKLTEDDDDEEKPPVITSPCPTNAEIAAAIARIQSESTVTTTPGTLGTYTSVLRFPNPIGTKKLNSTDTILKNKRTGQNAGACATSGTADIVCTFERLEADTTFVAEISLFPTNAPGQTCAKIFVQVEFATPRNGTGPNPSVCPSLATAVAAQQNETRWVVTDARLGAKNVSVTFGNGMGATLENGDYRLRNNATGQVTSSCPRRGNEPQVCTWEFLTPGNYTAEISQFPSLSAQCAYTKAYSEKLIPVNQNGSFAIGGGTTTQSVITTPGDGSDTTTAPTTTRRIVGKRINRVRNAEDGVMERDAIDETETEEVATVPQRATLETKANADVVSPAARPRSTVVFSGDLDQAVGALGHLVNADAATLQRFTRIVSPTKQFGERGEVFARFGIDVMSDKGILPYVRLGGGVLLHGNLRGHLNAKVNARGDVDGMGGINYSQPITRGPVQHVSIALSAQLSNTPQIDWMAATSSRNIRIAPAVTLGVGLAHGVTLNGTYNVERKDLGFTLGKQF